MIGQSIGDSGTFGSQSQMNKIAKGQQMSRNAFNARKPTTPMGNKMATAQLTGKAPWDKFSNKLTR